MADEDKPEESLGVGVLGWLGFLIINWACWGIVTLSTSSSFIFGFAISLVYTLILIALAICLGAQAKFKNFVILFWVLACSFVFVSGSILSFQIAGVSDPGNSFPNGGVQPWFDNDITQVLPQDSSDALKKWAAVSLWKEKRMPMFALFADHTYFSEEIATPDEHGKVLQISDGVKIKTLSSVGNPASFVKFDSKLYFLAANRGSDSQHPQLWSTTKDNPTEPKQITEVSIDFEHLYLDEQSSELWFKGSYSCPGTGTWVQTVFHSDGTSDGTKDLREGICGSTPAPASSPSPSPIEQDRSVAWYILFLGVVPMMGLAAWALVSKKIPGVVLNLWVGGIMIFVIVYAATYAPDDYFLSAFKWFFNIYSSLGYIALVFVSVRFPRVPAWVEDLKTWSVFGVSVSFYLAVHLVLEVPFTSEVWPWWVYFVIVLIQLAMSVFISRTLPMIMGAIGLFGCSVRLSWGIVGILGLDNAGITGALAMLALVALMGLGIIGGAIAYTNKKTEIDNQLRALLVKFNSDFDAIETPSKP